jgi:hypothetical protein
MKIEEVLNEYTRKFLTIKTKDGTLIPTSIIDGGNKRDINILSWLQKTLQQQEKDIKADILEKVEEYIKEERESVMSELADSQTELVGDKIKDIIKEV